MLDADAEFASAADFSSPPAGGPENKIVARLAIPTNAAKTRLRPFILLSIRFSFFLFFRPVQDTSATANIMRADEPGSSPRHANSAPEFVAMTPGHRERTMSA